MSRRSDVPSRVGEDGDAGGGMTLELGAPIGCTEGELGELIDVVLDPHTGHVTHLVVQARHHEMPNPRLVPVTLAKPRLPGPGLMLRCTLRDFDAMDPVRQFASVADGAPRAAAGDGQWDVGKVDPVAPAVPLPLDTGPTSYQMESTVSYHRVPKYEIELGRTSPVRSSDAHHLGHLLALIIDGKGFLTGFVLERRRLWMRTRLTVPMEAVEEMGTDLVTLSLSRAEAKRLPAVTRPAASAP